MSLVKYIPFSTPSLLHEFSTRWDSLFDDMIGDFLGNHDLITTSKSGYPKVDVYENDKELKLEASVPGLTKNDIKVEWSDGVLTISGQKQISNEKSSKTYHVKELHKSTFSRSFSISSNEYKVDETKADVKDGLLTIIIPLIKSKQKEVKTITIE